MKVLVLSHKAAWPDPASPSGFSASGGFPFQIEAIARLFDCSEVLITHPSGRPPAGLTPISGPNLAASTLPTPHGGRWHKLLLIPWAARHLPIIWRSIARAEAVHAAVPGDVGTIGLIIALLQRKKLFVRHCGTWGEPVTSSDRLLLWLLERIAGGNIVVLATGGSDSPPSRRNPNIEWIFSTTLSQAELDSLAPASPWRPGEPLRLITACRLAEGKNVQAVLNAIPGIRPMLPDVQFDVLGDGEYRRSLEALAAELGILDRVTFHGNVSHPQVLRAMSQAHLFIFPTRVKEGFPKAVLEALACGLPVVATDVSVIPRLLSDGAGVVLKEPSVAEIAGAILDLAGDRGRMAAAAARARRAAAGYTLEAWGAAIGEHLQAAWGPLKTG